MLKYHDAPHVEEDGHASNIAPAGERGGARGGGALLGGSQRCGDADTLSDGGVGDGGLDRTPDSATGAAQRRYRATGAAPLSGRRRGGGAASPPAGPHVAHPRALGSGLARRDRRGPAYARSEQRQLDYRAPGRLSGRADRLPGGDRNRAHAPASRRLCLQAAHLDAGAQGRGAAGVGKKRLKVEVLLAAAALPSPPPPLAALLPDLSFSDLLAPEDPFMNKLLALLPQADLYLQDEVQIALHPTIT